MSQTTESTAEVEELRAELAVATRVVKAALTFMAEMQAIADEKDPE